MIASVDTNTAKMYYYLYDANGNVGQLIDVADGSLTAHYEYDPYGNLLTKTGSYADANPYRFSSKYFDQEIGLGYWGYRFYSAALGRWINRDPLGEEGGINLYAYVQNNPINAFDFLGLWLSWTHRHLTQQAWASSSPSADKYAADILAILINENLSVDTGAMKNTNYWHFNRDLDEPPWQAIWNYYLNIENNLTGIDTDLNNPNKQNCPSALRTFGRLTHAWEDYYAHAIPWNQNPLNPIIGPISGNPDDPSDMPSNWGGPLLPGEHAYIEPGERAVDRGKRLADAANFVAHKMTIFTYKWWEACKCYANKIFGN